MQHAVSDPTQPGSTGEGSPPAGEALEARARREARDAALLVFRHMLRLRLVSERMVRLQQEGKVAFHASCIGQEGAIVAAALAAREGDWVFPGTREWGAALVRGLPLSTYVQHAFGTGEDPAKGHAAPDHPPARGVKVAPASGVAGAHVPQAVGFAWAARIRKEDVATVALFGDGATSSGDFHNALNFAGVFKPAVVLVCRNESGRPAGALADKAIAYGIASARASGADALETYAVVRAGILRAAEGKGTLLVEVGTSPVDSLDGKDVLAVSEHDPLVPLRRTLEREGRMDSASEEAMRAEIRAEIDAAVAAAESAPAPRRDTLFEDVYARVPRHLEAQRASMPKE